MRGTRHKLVVLTARDRRLLSELGVMRVVDRELAKVVAGFGSTTRANTRLLALTQAGYLKREFVGTIAGGRKAVYNLSKKALTVSNALADRHPNLSGTGSHSQPFLEHQLHINEV